MKLLVIGGHGMAGHVIADYLAAGNRHEVWRTVRDRPREPRTVALDVTDESRLYVVLKRLRPDLVINAAGILNHHADRNKEQAIRVNSLLPHMLVRYGRLVGFRLIHISTDCVFSGQRGDYKENDAPCGSSVYARTKQMGEVNEAPDLTIRTSIIGPELKPDGIGLFHWFMGRTGEVPGYTQVYWNGVTTLQLAKTIEWTLGAGQPLSGLVHLASRQKVSKSTLLQLIKEVYGRHDIRILPQDGHPSDKSLVNTRQDFPISVPDYVEMLKELKVWMAADGRERYARYVMN